mgnify:CR=1 FL=1
MADTTNYGWSKPTVGGDTDTWGTKLNTAFDDIDTDLKTVSDAVSAKLTTASNLSDVPNKSAARNNLGVAIGANVQAQSARLDKYAALSLPAGRIVYTSGSEVLATSVLGEWGRSFIANGSASAGRSSLELGTSATYNIGVTGANIPLMSNGNIWSNFQAFPVGSTYNSKRIAHVNSGTSTNSGRISWGTSAPGTLEEGEIYLRHN